MMRILVTGGAGFIGSHVVDAYLERGHQVTVLDNLSTGRLENLNPRAQFLKGDIRDENLLSRLFKKGRFDAINHHAAQIDVRKSAATPSWDADINVMGLLKLLEASRAARVRKIVFSSSGGTIYGECNGAPPREGAAERPLSPYGVAKLAGEHYIKAHSALHKLDYVILRYGNVYGPRQDPLGEAGVVAIFAARMLEGRPVFIFGDGRQRRDFVYVKDVAAANVLALKSQARRLAVNIGRGHSIDINRLFRLMARWASYDREPVYKARRPGELTKSTLNVTAALSLLGWKSRTDLEAGLRATVDFFKTGCS